MIASFPPVQQYNSFQNIVQSSAKNFLFRLVCTRMYIAETSTKSTHAYFQKKKKTNTLSLSPSCMKHQMSRMQMHESGMTHVIKGFWSKSLSVATSMQRC